MATHSSNLAWRILWTEEAGRLQSMGSQRVRHDRSDLEQPTCCLLINDPSNYIPEVPCILFFQLAESGRYDEAASMLFKNNVDTVYDEPKPLDNKDMEKVKTLLSSLPIKSHTIDYIKFKEVYENEVKCTAIIMEAHDNIPEVKTVFYFKPVSYLGKWKLCLVDSHHGDQTVIKADKKDSMQNEYQKEMREKNLQELKK